MIVSVGIPDTIKSSSMILHYTLTNTYENIISRGRFLYTPSAFGNISDIREIYEYSKVKNINQITNGKAIYGELENKEEFSRKDSKKTYYGEYIAYGDVEVVYNKINAFKIS